MMCEFGFLETIFLIGILFREKKLQENAKCVGRQRGKVVVEFGDPVLKNLCSLRAFLGRSIGITRQQGFYFP